MDRGVPEKRPMTRFLRDLEPRNQDQPTAPVATPETARKLYPELPEPKYEVPNYPPPPPNLPKPPPRPTPPPQPPVAPFQPLVSPAALDPSGNEQGEDPDRVVIYSLRHEDPNPPRGGSINPSGGKARQNKKKSRPTPPQQREYRSITPLAPPTDRRGFLL